MKKTFKSNELFLLLVYDHKSKIYNRLIQNTVKLHLLAVLYLQIHRFSLFIFYIECDSKLFMKKMVIH